MKVLYTLKIKKLDPIYKESKRKELINLFKQINATRKETGNYIRMVKKNSLRSPVVEARHAVQNLRYLFTDKLDSLSTVGTIERVYQGRVIQETYNVFLPNSYKDILESIRSEIRHRRQCNKYRGDDPFFGRERNRVLVQYQKKVLGIAKRPKDNSNYIGIEIECVTPRNADMTKLLPFAKWVNVGGDGSIQYGNNEDGTEIRVCMKREEIRTVLPRLMDTIKELGAKVNRSCGLHVHLDQRNNLNPDQSYAKLVRSLGLLFQVVPASRRNNNYCHKNRGTDWNRAIDGGRYKAINAAAYRRYRTIEIRLFGGTLNANKIINWIETLIAISEGKMVNRCPKNFDTAKNHWNFSDENLAWLKARQAMFASLNASMPSAESDVDEAEPMGVREEVAPNVVMVSNNELSRRANSLIEAGLAHPLSEAEMRALDNMISDNESQLEEVA